LVVVRGNPRDISYALSHNLRLIRAFPVLCHIKPTHQQDGRHFSRIPLPGARPRAGGSARKTPLMRLSASDLTCRRGGREVFSGLGFSVAGGEALLVTGRNGSGKSSLLRLVAGLLRSAGGQIALEGGDPELSIAEQAHYLGHQDALKPSLTVGENLQVWSRYLGPVGSLPEAALATVGLAELADLPAAYLSAGQQRRLSLARLVAVQRPIWLLDEPASTLDTPGQARLVDLMRGHLARGGLILAAAHGAFGIENARELRLGEGI
jgi:heme exporter protein A